MYFMRPALLECAPITLPHSFRQAENRTSFIPNHKKFGKKIRIDANQPISNPRKNTGIWMVCELPRLRVVKLRDHPAMRWQGRPNWPPEWKGPYGPERPLPRGEVGTLLKAGCGFGNVRVPHCYIDMEWNGQEYVGLLYFDDPELIGNVCQILEAQVGRAISEIGSLDVEIGSLDSDTSSLDSATR
jgi:hypothetical protein